MGTRPEHVAMDSFPAGVISVDRLGVARVVERERAHHDEGDESREEDDDHEAVEHREPVDLRLEEGALQVAVEAPRVATRARRPAGGDAEDERPAGERGKERLVGLHQLRVRGGHVHLHDAVAVEAEAEVSVCVDERVLRHHVVVRPVRLQLAQFLLRYVQIAHLRPDRKTVYLHLRDTREKRVPNTSSGWQSPSASCRSALWSTRYSESTISFLRRAKGGPRRVLPEGKHDSRVLKSRPFDHLGNASLLQEITLFASNPYLCRKDVGNERLAKGKVEVVVGFMRIVIGTDLFDSPKQRRWIHDWSMRKACLRESTTVNEEKSPLRCGYLLPPAQLC